MEEVSAWGMGPGALAPAAWTLARGEQRAERSNRDALRAGHCVPGPESTGTHDEKEALIAGEAALKGTRPVQAGSCGTCGFKAPQKHP